MEQLIKIITWSFPAGRIFGIPLRINWLVLLLFVWPIVGALVQGAAGGGGGLGFRLFLSVIVLAMLYVSVLLHELGHCWGMRLVGDDIHEIQLTPIGGVAIGGGPNRSPRTELIVVGLGPAVSALLALLGWVLSVMFQQIFGSPQQGTYSYTTAVAFYLINYFKEINTLLLLFNLFTPLFPLDSAKILRALLSLRWNPNQVTEKLAKFGIGLGIVLFLASFMRIPLPFLGNGSVFLGLIGVLGVQVCLWELRSLEHNEVYTTYHGWGERPVYFDSETVDRAGARARGDLGVFGRLMDVLPAIGGIRRSRHKRGPTLPGKGRTPGAEMTSARAKRGPLKPMFSPGKARGPGEVRLVVPDPDTLNDAEEIRELMRAAAEAEDFTTAARLKKRLVDLGHG